MKFVVKINDRKMLLTAAQVEDLVELIADSEYYHEEYMGPDKGTMGSNNAYEPRVRPCNVDEWFDAKVMRDDMIETIKLRMKLEKEK